MADGRTTTRPRTRRPRTGLRADPDLRAVQEFADLVVASSRSATQRERLDRAIGGGVTTASLRALRQVERLGPVSVGDLARRLELDQSTLSRQIRPLEEAGLIARTPHRTDRRVALIDVTDTGRDLLQRARDVALNDYDVALDDWSSQDRRTLASLLDRFRRDLLAVRTDQTGWAVDKEARPDD